VSMLQREGWHVN